MKLNSADLANKALWEEKGYILDALNYYAADVEFENRVSFIADLID